MAKQYRVGIEGLTEDEILAIIPKRLDGRALATMSNADLVRLRNACRVAEGYFQTVADGRRLAARAERVDVEVERRGLDAWMSQPCKICGEYKDLVIESAGLVGHCRCTRALNRALGPVRL